MKGEFPARMRVAVVHAWGDVRIEERPVPIPGPGEAVVRIEACGLCGSDAMPWYVDSKAPVVLGHEPAGEIVAVADDVSAFAPGERVFVHHHAPCMDCAECARGLWSNCATWRATHLDPGGFAEYARVPATNLAADTLRLPDDLDFETATFIEPVACCLRAVRRKGAVSPVDGVHIVGLGAMGLVMVQLARVFGAARVTGADFEGGRRDLARDLGADLAIDAADPEVGAATRAAHDGRGADVVLVTPGDPAAVRAGILAAAPGGRVVCFTPQAPDVPLALDQNRMYFREVALLQSYSCGPDETRNALDLLAAGALDTRPLVTHRAGLDGVSDGLDRALERSEGIKTVILPSE
jgi:L-iditol 2-dehydrogenase